MKDLLSGAPAVPEAGTPRFLALHSWRGIAALLVALFHLNALGHFYGLDFIRNSFYFVDFFFVLSGFVISYSSYGQLTGSRSVLPFMIKRFGRVWPLHALMLAAFIAFPLGEWAACHATHLCGTAWPFDPQHENLGTALSSLFLLHALGFEDAMSWNWPSWSISAEFWTYLVFAITVVLFRRLLVPLALVIAIAAEAAIFLFAPSYVTYSYSFLRCVTGFYAGFLIFRLYMSRRLPVRKPATLLEVGSVSLVISFVVLAGTSPLAFAAPIVFATCIYVFAHQAGLLSALLIKTPFLRLGQWSYSIYMIHAFVLIVMLRLSSVAEKLMGEPIRIYAPGYTPELYYYHDKYSMDLLALIYLAIVIALASITYRKFEAPVRDYFNGVARGVRLGGESTAAGVAPVATASLGAVESSRGDSK